METPDKIYLNTPKIQPELDNTTWDTKTYTNCENVEYIRKDAVVSTIKDYLTNWLDSYRIERLIDKIEEL